MGPTRDEYRRLAPLYEAVVGPFLRGVRREVAREARALGLRQVLDVCCGTGEGVRVLAAAGIEAVGVDLSPAMLGVSKRSPEAISRLVRGDATRLPFADGAFDGAVLSFALHEKEQDAREAILRETLRVVRRPGRLLIADYRLTGGEPLPLRYAIGIVERLAGARHHRNFRDYLRRGGLSPLVAGRGLTLLSERAFFGGAVVLAAFSG